jgi:hypothetical protein
MRGLDAGSSWTHLIPGLILSGVGVGFINPPLASTAVGVVQPQRAGMASGINSTFRQMGIATGIALLGTLFSNHLTSAVHKLTTHTALAAHAGEITSGLRSGEITPLYHLVPAAQAGLLTEVLRGSFASSLDVILLVGAILSFAAAILSFGLIRSKDFVQTGAGEGPPPVAH